MSSSKHPEGTGQKSQWRCCERGQAPDVRRRFTQRRKPAGGDRPLLALVGRAEVEHETCVFLACSHLSVVLGVFIRIMALSCACWTMRLGARRELRICVTLWDQVELVIQESSRLIPFGVRCDVGKIVRQVAILRVQAVFEF